MGAADTITVHDVGAATRAPRRRKAFFPPVRTRPAGRPTRLGLRQTLAEGLERRRLFNLLPFCAILGLATYAGLAAEPWPWALAGVGLALVVIALAGLANIVLLRLAALALAFWAGFCLLPLHGALSGTPMLAYPAFGTYEVTIDEIVSDDGIDRRIVISAIIPAEDARPLPIRRARLLMPAESPVSPGQRIRARMRFVPVPGPVSPGSYDGQFHSYFDGIGAYGTLMGQAEILSQPQGLDAGRAVETLRRNVAARIVAILPGQTGAIGQAMVMGDQSGISDETREVLAASGLAHIYSISGLHLSMVAGGIFAAIRLALALTPGLARRLSAKKIAAAGGLVAAVLYLMLAGGMANVPAFRSTLMLGLIFGAVLAGRRALTMRNVALSALVIIAFDPAAVFRPSFQLSFAAVAALVGCYELPRKPLLKSPGWLTQGILLVGGTALTSLIAGLATLLFSVYHFQQTAPLGVLGNVLALPVVGLVIMPMAIVSLLAMPLGLEWPFVSAMGWGIERMVEIGAFVASLSTGLEAHPLLAPSAMLIGVLALAWFAFFANYWRLFGPVLAIPAVLFLAGDQRPDLLVADTTQAVAIADANGMQLVTGREGSFAVNAWAEQYNQPITEAGTASTCDTLACLAHAPTGALVSVILQPDAFAEDCANADLVVTRLRAPSTCQTTLIDAEDLRIGGTHWVKWQNGRIFIRPSIVNPDRPWRIMR